MKPLALDLCCGKGGWTVGLQAAGWEVIGFDIETRSDYPGDKMVVGDIRNVCGKHFKNALLVCASPPCQEFSKLSLPFFHKLKKSGFQPDKTIWEACIRIAREAEAPLILENVRGAEAYMGKSDRRYGSFYLWGDVPALLPTGNPRKGLSMTLKDRLSGNYKGGRQFGSKSKQRKELSAKIAMIPKDLSVWIGECFYPKEINE